MNSLLFLLLAIVTNKIPSEIVQNMPAYRTREKQNLKTSIIIPCHPKHAYLLFTTLMAYENQTVIPDEVVISLSEQQLVPKSIIKKLQNSPWSFSLKIILSDEKMFAGENRNNACRNATGDVFICQDADDTPHPQRTELIKYFFENYKLDHLMHRCLFFEDFSFFPSYDPKQIPILKPKEFQEAYNCYEKKNSVLEFVTNGNIAIARHVFEKAQWRAAAKGQDVEFNQRVYSIFTKCMVLKVPLVVYNIHLSSWKTMLAEDPRSINPNFVCKQVD